MNSLISIAFSIPLLVSILLLLLDNKGETEEIILKKKRRYKILLFISIALFISFRLITLSNLIETIKDIWNR